MFRSFIDYSRFLLLYANHAALRSSLSFSI
nr:MAG TPA: hypothetical protein [Caudoviricetes sp.]